jgi:hypothetical protein
MEEVLRLPPNSPEAEVCVLGSILIDNDAVLAVSDFLRSEHFYNQNYGKVSPSNDISGIYFPKSKKFSL